MEHDEVVLTVPLARLLDWAHRVQKQNYYVVITPSDMNSCSDQGIQTDDGDQTHHVPFVEPPMQIEFCQHCLRLAPSSRSIPRASETECGEVPLPSAPLAAAPLTLAELFKRDSVITDDWDILEDDDPLRTHRRPKKKAQSTMLPEVNAAANSDVVDQLKREPCKHSEDHDKDRRHSLGDLILPVLSDAQGTVDVELVDDEPMCEPCKDTPKQISDCDSSAVIPSSPLKRPTVRKQRRRSSNICWTFWVNSVIVALSFQLVSVFVDVPVSHLATQSACDITELVVDGASVFNRTNIEVLSVIAQPLSWFLPHIQFHLPSVTPSTVVEQTMEVLVPQTIVNAKQNSENLVVQIVNMPVPQTPGEDVQDEEQNTENLVAQIVERSVPQTPGEDVQDEEQNIENLVAQIVARPGPQTLEEEVQAPSFISWDTSAMWSLLGSFLHVLAEDRLLCGVIHSLGVTVEDKEHHIENPVMQIVGLPVAQLFEDLAAQVVDIPVLQTVPVVDAEQNLENLVLQIVDMPVP
eukprot:1123607-Amphidinium_carterae.1